jgi:hypothetical protein
MTDAKDQNDHERVLNFANETIIADAVSPKLSQAWALHGLSDAAGIVESCYAVVEKSEDPAGVLGVKPGQLSFRGGGNLNLPGHDAS